MKKIANIMLSFALTLTLAACGSSSQEASKPAESNTPAQPAAEPAKEAEKKSSYPEKPIQVIVSYAAGGGTDVGARIMLPYVEKELGVPVQVVNKPGGGGWVGWTELAQANPDGYTIGYINTPNLMTGYLDPQYKRQENLESFVTIANHVTDPGVIAIHKDETRFTDAKSFMEYAKANDVTGTSTGVGSDDHLAGLKLNHKFSTKIVSVHNKGAADSQAAVMGGHVDALFANVGEVTTLHNNGEIKVIAVLAKERSPFLPDVPTLEESGYEGIISGSSRGLAAPKGIDPEKLEILKKAFEVGIKNEEQTKKMEEMGLQVNFKVGQEYDDMLKSDEQSVKELGPLLGW